MKRTSPEDRQRRVAVLAAHPVDPANELWVQEAMDAWFEEDGPLHLFEYLGWSAEMLREWTERCAADPTPEFLPDAARWSPSEPQP